MTFSPRPFPFVGEALLSNNKLLCTSTNPPQVQARSSDIWLILGPLEKRFNCSQRNFSRPASLGRSHSQPRPPIPSRDKVLEHQRLPRSRLSSSLSTRCGFRIPSPQSWVGERLRSRPSRMIETALCKSTIAPQYAQNMDHPHQQHCQPF